MPPRGRSRDVSPITLTTTAHGHHVHAQLDFGYVSPSNLNKPGPLPSHTTRRPIPTHPTASSSRLEPSPPFGCSQSSTSSTSSDLTPAPLTPPILAKDVFPVRTRRELSFDYYDSPPSPPRTLEDQMHVAYADDNLHLAKILLLKLKGIEVTGEDDPRIAQVKDEDFNATFIPHGGLWMDEEAERRCQEGQRRERERRRRIARDRRLKQCEQIWDKNTKAWKEEKAKAALRKEAVASVRRRVGQETRERERVRERDPGQNARTAPGRAGRPCGGSSRPVLSYGNLPALSRRANPSTSQSPPKAAYEGPLFDYPYMVPSSSYRISPPAVQPTKSTADGPYRELNTLTDRTVPFSHVVASMNGPLFPLSDDEESPKRKRSIQQQELLRFLLEPVTWDVGENPSAKTAPSIKGKARAGVQDNTSAYSLTSLSTSASSFASSLSSSVRRSASWFSFGSRASVATVLTTPSSSPLACNKPLQPPPMRSHVTGNAGCSAVYSSSPRTLSTPIAPSETPLTTARPPFRFSSSTPQLDAEGMYLTRGRLLTRRNTADVIDRSSPSQSGTVLTSSGLVARVSRSVSTFMDMAAQFQRAYVKATMYTANPDIYFSSHPRSRSRSTSRSRTRSPGMHGRTRRGGLRPEGYRVSCADVEVFTSVDTIAPTLTTTSTERPLIPLSNTSTPTAYPRVFPSPPAIPRSPFRLAHPPPTLTSRLRPVANPLLLRMRALHNLCGLETQVPDVREKVVGVAWEGIGRSGLGREVKR